AAEAVALPPGGGVRTVGRDGDPESRCARDQRDQHGSQGGDRRRTVSRRSLLPVERAPHPGPAAPRADGRYLAPRETVHRGGGEKERPGGAVAPPRRDRSPADLRVARQYPRVAKSDGTDGGAESERRDRRGRPPAGAGRQPTLAILCRADRRAPPSDRTDA